MHRHGILVYPPATLPFNQGRSQRVGLASRGFDAGQTIRQQEALFQVSRLIGLKRSLCTPTVGARAGVDFRNRLVPSETPIVTHINERVSLDRLVIKSNQTERIVRSSPEECRLQAAILNQRLGQKTPPLHRTFRIKHLLAIALAALVGALLGIGVKALRGNPSALGTVSDDPGGAFYRIQQFKLLCMDFGK